MKKILKIKEGNLENIKVHKNKKEYKPQSSYPFNSTFQNTIFIIQNLRFYNEKIIVLLII
jgi:hypothetical protein